MWWDGQTETHKNMTKLIVAFRNFGKARKKIKNSFSRNLKFFDKYITSVERVAQSV